MRHKSKNITILKGLNRIPPGSEILRIDISVAWLIYIKFSPVHFYCIIVEKKIEKEKTKNVC